MPPVLLRPRPAPASASASSRRRRRNRRRQLRGYFTLQRQQHPAELLILDGLSLPLFRLGVDTTPAPAPATAPAPVTVILFPPRALNLSLFFSQGGRPFASDSHKLAAALTTSNTVLKAPLAPTANI